MRREHWREYWQVWCLFGATCLLTASHLIPLPFNVWSHLPGRDVIVEVDAAAGLGQIWRPLSMEPNSTINALLALLTPLAALTLTVQLSPRDQRRLISIVIALAAVSAFVGVLQLSGVNIAIYDKAADIHPSGLFNNRNHQAALLAAAVPLAALAFRGGFGWSKQGKGGKIFSVCLIASLIPLLVVTGSRSGVLLAVVSVAASAIMVFTGEGGESWRKRRTLYACAAAAFIFIVICAAVYLARDTSFQRFAGANEDLRYAIWQSTWTMLPSYWPWGTGIGSYASAYQILEPANMLRPDFTNHAHNEYLEVIFTAGVPGLIVMALGVLFVLSSVVRLRKVGSPQKDIPAAGLSMIILLAAASATDYPLRTPIMLALLAIAMALAAVGSGRRHKAQWIK